MNTDFSKFDKSFGDAPATRKKTEIDDGDFDAAVKIAEMKETSSGTVFGFKFTVLSDGKFKGKIVEKPIFFNKKDGTTDEKEEWFSKRVADLKADLKTLGFDVENWKPENGRPFMSQLPAACALAIDMKVRIRLKTSGEYQNCFLNKRLADDKPAKIGEAEIKAQLAKQVQEQTPFNLTGTPADTPPAQENGDPIPF